MGKSRGLGHCQAHGTSPKQGWWHMVKKAVLSTKRMKVEPSTSRVTRGKGAAEGKGLDASLFPG